MAAADGAAGPVANRLPARRVNALVRLGRLSHRCGVSPASFRLRFQGRLRDPRRGDCRPRGAVGDGCPGYRRPRRANTVLEKPVALSGSASHLINRARAATGPRRSTVMHTYQPDPQGPGNRGHVAAVIAATGGHGRRRGPAVPEHGSPKSQPGPLANIGASIRIPRAHLGSHAMRGA